MSISSRIGRNTIYLFTSSIVSKILNLVFIIYIARKLGAFHFGNFSLANSLVQIVVILADLGITMLVVREISREREKASELIGKLAPLKLILSGVTILAVFLIAEILNYPARLKVIIYLFTIYYIFYSLATFYRSVFLSWEKMEYDAFIAIAEKVFIVGLGLLAVFLGYGVPGLALIYIAGGIFGLLITYFTLKKKFITPIYSFNKKFYLSSLRASYPFALSSFLTMIFLYVDTVMISKMRGNVEVGWYSAGFNFVYQLRIFASVFLGAAFPVFSRLAKTSPGYLKQLYTESSRFLLPIAIPLAVGGAILARPLIMSFFGQEYLETIMVFKTLILVMPILYLNGLFGYLLVSIDRQHLVLSYLIVATLANVAANFILIPRYGALAAAWTSVMAETIFFILCFNYWKQNFYSWAILRYVFHAGVASLIMGICLKILMNINIFWLVIIGIIIYGVVLLISGYFKKEDWTLLLNTIRGQG